MDVSRSESVAHEVNRLIAKRHDQHMTEEGHWPSEELWKASVERYNCKRERQLRDAWCEYHQDQAARHRAVLEALVKHHEAAAARLAAASLPLQATDGRRMA